MLRRYLALKEQYRLNDALSNLFCVVTKGMIIDILHRVRRINLFGVQASINAKAESLIVLSVCGKYIASISVNLTHMKVL